MLKIIITSLFNPSFNAIYVETPLGLLILPGVILFRFLIYFYLFQPACQQTGLLQIPVNKFLILCTPVGVSHLYISVIPL